MPTDAPAALERKARAEIHAAYKHGYAQGHAVAEAHEPRFDPIGAADRYLASMPATTAELLADLASSAPKERGEGELEVIIRKLLTERGDDAVPIVFNALHRYAQHRGAETPARLHATLLARRLSSALTAYPVAGEVPVTPESELATEILAELRRARMKFPGDNVTTLALVEEVGELAKATFEESRAQVRKEAVQVATMAMRVVLDGDQTLDVWRESRGLDPLLEARGGEQ